MEKKEKKENKETKKESKFDLKKEVKQAWKATLRFLKPFKNLDKKVFLNTIEPFLSEHIQLTYVIGCAILLSFTVFSFFISFPTIMQLLIFVIVFVGFRLLCEIIVSKN